MWNDIVFLGDGGYYVPSREYHRLRQQEELRRLREAEQAYRQEELLRRKRAYEKEFARRRRREVAVEERRRSLETEDALRGRQHLEAVKGKQEPRPASYQLVLGDDGYLYRIPIFLKNKDRPENYQRRTKPVRSESPLPTSKTDDTGAPLRPSRNAETFDKAPQVLPDDKENHVTVTVAIPRKSDDKKKSGRRRVTVVVEDASDSESDDEWKSVWRNRRPSPGKWIEPVEDNS